MEGLLSPMRSKVRGPSRGPFSFCRESGPAAEAPGARERAGLAELLSGWGPGLAATAPLGEWARRAGGRGGEAGGPAVRADNGHRKRALRFAEETAIFQQGFQSRPRGPRLPGSCSRQEVPTAPGCAAVRASGGNAESGASPAPLQIPSSPSASQPEGRGRLRGK